MAAVAECVEQVSIFVDVFQFKIPIKSTHLVIFYDSHIKMNLCDLASQHSHKNLIIQ